MAFLKLVCTVSVITVLMCGVTFIATKNYYSVQPLPVNACVDGVLPSVSSSVIQPPQNIPGNAIAAQQELKTNNVSSPQQKNQTIGELVKVREQQQKHVDSFRQFITADHKQLLIDEANRRYEAESVDYQWAAEQEDKLLSAFIESSSLSSYTPTQMSCRSSTCKLTIPSQDEITADGAYQAIRQSLANQAKSVTYFRNPDKGEVVMYISAQENLFFN